MTQYYLKEIPSNRLFLPTGAPVPFIPVSREFGILATSDPLLIDELDKAISRQIGGVSKISEAEYKDFQDKKKDKTSLLNLPPERVEIKPMSSEQLKALRNQGAVAAIAGTEPPRSVTAEPQKVEPLAIPKEFTKPTPRVGRVPPATLKP